MPWFAAHAWYLGIRRKHTEYSKSFMCMLSVPTEFTLSPFTCVSLKKSVCLFCFFWFFWHFFFCGQTDSVVCCTCILLGRETAAYMQTWICFLLDLFLVLLTLLLFFLLWTHRRSGLLHVHYTWTWDGSIRANRSLFSSFAFSGSFDTSSFLSSVDTQTQWFATRALYLNMTRQHSCKPESARINCVYTVTFRICFSFRICFRECIVFLLLIFSSQHPHCPIDTTPYMQSIVTRKK